MYSNVLVLNGLRSFIIYRYVYVVIWKLLVFVYFGIVFIYFNCEYFLCRFMFYVICVEIREISFVFLLC